MVGWYILGGIFLLLLIVWLLRVSVQIAFGQELHVMLQIGPKKLTILPKQDKLPKKGKEKKKKPAPEQKAEKKEKKKFPFTFEDVRSALPVVFDALKKTLGKLRRRMVVDPLDVSITFAGNDPAKVAEMYGWAGTAVWTMMPQLEQLLHIPHPHIHLDVDYNTFRISAEGRVGVKFRVGDLIVIVLTLAVPVLKWYMAWRKKNAAPKEPPKEETKNV